MSFIGIDAAGSRLVVAELNGRKLKIYCKDNLNFLLEEKELERVLIDIPIGLADKSEYRQCDALCRDLISGRSSCFFAPDINAYSKWIKIDKQKKKLNKIQKELNQKLSRVKLSSQVVAIMPKIEEVRTFLETNGRAIKGEIFESHPELCFSGLKKGELSKKSSATVLSEAKYSKRAYRYC
ncbi:DUF429 domain-containing protein [Paenibacillus sp. sgz500992]|uniref:DUF429 domain-containing protein n=1 Tax=Paenibacillus sp. sgz500992 TaxID=3242476 RepID=UPI0036D2D37C